MYFIDTPIVAGSTPNHRGGCQEGDNEFDREGADPPSRSADPGPLPGQEQDCPPTRASSQTQTPTNRLDQLLWILLNVHYWE